MEDILKARNFRVNLENSSTKMLQNMHILRYIQLLKLCNSLSSEDELGKLWGKNWAHKTQLKRPSVNGQTAQYRHLTFVGTVVTPDSPLSLL